MCVCGDDGLAMDPGPWVSGDQRYLLRVASLAIYKHAHILWGPLPSPPPPPKAQGVRAVSLDINERQSSVDTEDVSLSHCFSSHVLSKQSLLCCSCLYCEQNFKQPQEVCN